MARGYPARETNKRSTADGGVPVLRSGRMDLLTLARLHALGRVALGKGLLLAPSLYGTAWLGRGAARRPGTQVALAGLGARDVAIGYGAAWALGGGTGARPWLLAGVLADAVDLAVTIRHRDALPPAAVIGVGALAGGSAALGLWLQRALD
jgi:hypothetical protein